MNIFRQLRWKLTLSYTLVTVSAFLAIVLIAGGLVFAQVFVPGDSLNPERMIDDYLTGRIRSNYAVWSRILSQSPVDMDLVDLYLHDSQSVINSEDLFGIGAARFSVSTNASIRVLIFGPDGILLGTSVLHDSFLRAAIGHPFDPTQVLGLEGPLEAALTGDTDPKRLYTAIEPNQRYVFAAPVFNSAGGDGNQVVGVIAIIFDAVPTQADIPAHILNIAGRGLLILLLCVGIIGAIFGGIFSNGLTRRFQQMSATADLWSLGDFTRYIDDTKGDEISQFAGRLNNMARQMQGLLHRRQDMAVSEERNRLARDLHDSAKQQALAASLELGAVLTLYERDPQGARKHLVEADTLVDSVRKELTNLVDELRPQPINGPDFSEVLREQATEWSHRNGIEVNLEVEGNGGLSSETRETLFRIAQEALANVARHSSASCADVILEYGTDTATLIIKDDGCGFDTSAGHGGVGLSSMRERAEALGGSFAITSVPDQGTQIEVALPKGN